MAVNPAASLSVEQPNGRPLAITVASLAASSANDGNSVTPIGPLSSSRITIGQLKSGSFPAGAMVPQLPMGGFEDNVLLRASDVQAALGSYTGPLDIVSGAVFAYGQRALSAAKRGSPLYTIERNSDSTTRSFNSDMTTGAAPVAAISSFIGAGNGFLSVWNDQGPHGYDALQADPTQQSQWIASLANGFPGFTGIVATGAGTSVPSQTISLANGAATVFLVSGPDTEVFLTAGGSGYLDLYMGRSVSHGPYIDLFDGTNEAGGMYPPFSGVHVIDAAWQFGSADFRVDGVSQTQQSSFDSGGALTNPVVNGMLTLFIDYNASASINDVALEILVYNSILSGANRTAIRQNIATYYGITL